MTFKLNLPQIIEAPDYHELEDEENNFILMAEKYIADFKIKDFQVTEIGFSYYSENYLGLVHNNDHTNTLEVFWKYVIKEEPHIEEDLTEILVNLRDIIKFSKRKFIKESTKIIENMTCAKKIKLLALSQLEDYKEYDEKNKK